MATNRMVWPSIRLLHVLGSKKVTLFFVSWTRSLLPFPPFLTGVYKGHEKQRRGESPYLLDTLPTVVSCLFLSLSTSSPWSTNKYVGLDLKDGPQCGAQHRRPCPGWQMWLKGWEGGLSPKQNHPMHYSEPGPCLHPHCPHSCSALCIYSSCLWTRDRPCLNVQQGQSL